MSGRWKEASGRGARRRSEKSVIHSVFLRRATRAPYGLTEAGRR